MNAVRTAEGGLDQRAFRDLAGRFVTGVVVVTTPGKNEPSAMTANSFTSVSLEPPMVLVCLGTESRTILAITESRRFAVNILREDQATLSDEFARRGAARFNSGDRSLSDGGIPIVPGAIAYFCCDLVGIYPGGDHGIVVGEVTTARGQDGRPLVFHRGQYDELAGRLRDADWCWYS